MSKKIYVGNLSYSTTEETLRNQFSQFGEVETVTIIMDKITNRSKGFGFVDFTSYQEYQQVLENRVQKIFRNNKLIIK